MVRHSAAATPTSRLCGRHTVSSTVLEKKCLKYRSFLLCVCVNILNQNDMDYEKKYNEALERAKEFMANKGVAPNADAFKTAKELTETIFPELKEREDERIRKWIRLELESKYVVDNIVNNVMADKALAWLEKQGKKSNIHQDAEDDLRRQSTIRILEYARSLDAYNQYGKESINKDIAWLEKQGEQKHKIQPKFKIGDIIRFKGNETLKGEVESHKIVGYDNELYVFADGTTDLFCEQELYELVDKVGPKFKSKDWITNGEYTWKVIDIKPLDYILQSLNGDLVDDTISYVDEEFHLWTIQDAKDGDVLSQDSIPFIFKSWDNNCIAYCGITGFGLFKVVKDYFSWCNGINVTPATKEQRDLLFQKIHEAGYEWYPEKKELKEIESKPAWSEDDEKMLNKIIDELTPYGECPDYPSDEDREYYYIRPKMVDWLKSIKDRVRPQPKQEWNKEDEKILKELIEEVKDQLDSVPSPDCMDKEDEKVLKQLNKWMDWLKSIKNRVQLQPNQEWSEEDEKMRQETIDWFEKKCFPYALESENPARESIKWLKSLKPNNWKPSEEQIKSLRIALQSMPYSKDKETALSLLEQLVEL